jgi:transcriptional regulator with XRE-family HTH domain
MRDSLSNWRTKKGLHYTELAAKAGVSTRTIKRIEKGEPTNEITLNKLAAALGIASEDIEEWHTEKARTKPLRGFARPKTDEDSLASSSEDNSSTVTK